MLGTLNGALEARQVKLLPEAIACAAEGVNEVRDGLPVLTEVRIHYRLTIPAAAREGWTKRSPATRTSAPPPPRSRAL